MIYELYLEALRAPKEWVLWYIYSFENNINKLYQSFLFLSNLLTDGWFSG
jgi:hypothetical protein